MWTTLERLSTYLNSPQKYIIAEIIGAVPPTLRLISAEIALHRYLRVSRYITVYGVGKRARKKIADDDGQVGLIHEDGLVELAPQRSNEDLVHLVFHDQVREPPALSSLDRIPAKKKM
jgi:hypothetical protein